MDDKRYIPSGPIQSSLDGKQQWFQGKGEFKNNTISIAVTPSNEGGDPTDIQRAIDALADVGGTVYLRNGTYELESDIVLPSYVTLQGESGDGVVIDFLGAAHQIVAQGANPYSTGTVSATNGSATITGSGTSFNTGMIGRSIIISGIFFVITAVADTTHLTIESGFDSPSVTGASYVIADPVIGVLLKDLTVQNSTHSLGAVLFRYMSGGDMEGVSAYDSTIGFNYLDCSFVTAEDVTAIGCGTGINVNHCGVWTFTDFGAYGCTTNNIVFNRFISASVSNATSSSSGGNGITITNSSNLGIYDMTITSCAGKGIEVSNTNYIQLFSLAVQNNTSDGIKFTTNVDDSVINSCSFTNNGGYGINIASSNSADNVLSSSTFVSNTSGDYSNSGTSTILLLTAGSGGVTSVNSQTGVVVLTQDDVGDGTTYKRYSATDKSKLAGIEALADVTDSGNVGSSMDGASAKTTPVDADTMPLNDSAASQALKKVTWANIKATLKTYFDTLYTTAAAIASAITAERTATATLTGKTMSGASNTFSNIGNAALTNSAVTVAGTSVSLGGSITLDSITGLSSTGIIKRTGANALAIATAGTDYYNPGGTDVAIADGGTGASTKATAFDALSPMSASGDLIYGGASGTGTRLAKGTDGQVLVLASGLPSWSTPAGGGDVSSTGSISVDSELAIFSGTGGKTIKRASATGIAKLASGVLSAVSTLSTSDLGNGIVTADKLANASAAAYVATSQSLNSTGYTDLTTTTDTVTITVGANGLAWVNIGAFFQNTNAATVASMSFAISGATTLAASDKYSLQYQSFANNAFDRRTGGFLMTGLTPGSTTFKAKYKASGNFSTWADRHISATAL